jgi:hypothetical protein
MAAKQSKKPARTVKSLPAKAVTTAQAKTVKGGLNPQPLPPRKLPKI